LAGKKSKIVFLGAKNNTKMATKRPSQAKKAVQKPAAKKTYKVPSNISVSKSVAELKALDSVRTLLLNNAPAATNHNLLCNACIQGTDRHNRIGRRINIKSINIRAYVYTSAASPAVIDDLFRFALVWDEQPTAAFPVMSDFWQDVNLSGVATTTTLSHNNLNNSQRFRTLRTHSMPLNAELQALETNSGKAFWEWDVKCDFQTQYNAGNAGGLTDITTGAIYMIAWGNNSPVEVWSVDVACRIKYFDM